MDGKVIIETELGTKSFERQIAKVEDELEGLVATYEILAEDSTFNMESVEAIKLREDIEKLNNKLLDLRKKQQDLDSKPFTGIKDAINNIGSGIENTIKKVVKWGLAVFGVRGAYMFVRQAISTLSQTDDGMATKLEYIRWALANTIKPIIEWIINAVYKILGLFGGLIKAITGYNIFAKSTSKSFEKMKKSTGGISKNTSKIKRDLYGWDEMTRVTESSGALGGGAGGTGAGNLDFNIPDLSSLVEKYTKKVKEWWGNFKQWFFGGDNLKEGLQNAFRNFIPNLKSMFMPIYSTILKPYLEDPMRKIFKDTEPIWKPMKTAFSNVIDGMKIKWQELVNIIQPKVIEPISNAFNSYKEKFLSNFIPFINSIIDSINYTFGILGVNLKHIDTKVDNSGTNITKEIGGSLTDAKGKVLDLTNPNYVINISNEKISDTDGLISDLKRNITDITKKTWNIQTKITTSGNTLKDWYNNTLREKALKVGIPLPKLAKGGIINMPSRGVPLALGGEAGKEGVIPLTDSQQMELLGEAIGRYITINANITNTMNGRIISRELQKIQNESNFASNR